MSIKCYYVVNISSSSDTFNKFLNGYISQRSVRKSIKNFKYEVFLKRGELKRGMRMVTIKNLSSQEIHLNKEECGYCNVELGIQKCPIRGEI